METSDTPQGQNNTAKDANDSQNGSPNREASPSGAEAPPSTNQQNQADSHKDSVVRSWLRKNITLVLLIELAVFIVGVRVAIIYSRQLDQMVESNRINRESLQSVQRAFLSFAGISLGVNLNSPDNKKVGVVALLNWFNSGNTPAKRTISVGNYQTWRGELPESFDFHDFVKIDKSNYAQEVVGPHQVLPIQIPVSIDILRAQRAGTDRVFFYGWVVYNDVFSGDADRLTEFCTEMIQVAVTDVTKDISDPANNVAWNTQPCRWHNCYDEDCQDYAAKIKYAHEIK